MRTALVLVIFVLTFGALEVLSLRQKSATWDEPIHLTAGYAALSSGDYRVDPTHPPLMRMWGALPLVFMGASIDTSEIDRTPMTEWLPRGYGFAHEFLYRHNDADRLLYAARFMVVIWATLLGILIFCWAREWLGFGPAVLALAFYTLEPGLSAHGRLVTTDMAAALFLFGAVYMLWRTCRQPHAWNIAGLTACFALAFVTKFSAVLLIPILLALLATSVVLRGRISIKVAAGLVVLMATVTFFTIWAAYDFRHAPSSSGTWLLNAQDSPEVQARVPWLAAVTKWVDDRHILPNAFTHGFLLSQATSRLSAYLNGEVSPNGWWYYFPVAFLVKTPSVLLLLFIAGIVLFVWRRNGPGLLDYAFVVLPIVIYMAFAMASYINIGMRHILPIYPFVLLIAAAAAAELKNWRRPVGGIVLTGLMAFWLAVFAAVYPNTLTFFNLPSGGPNNGLDYLADSNLDWGQDLKGLKAWMESRNVRDINLAYFGTADPEYYGIHSTHLPGAPFFANDKIARPQLPGYVAISATVLSGVYLTPQWREFYSGFHEMDPVANIGNSIRVYWIDKWPEAAVRTDVQNGIMANADIHRWLGDALLYQLNWSDRAIVHYRKSVALDPGYREVRNHLVLALLKNGQMADAQREAEAALQRWPDDPVALDLLGLAFTGAGQLDAAAGAFERALQLAPDFDQARKHLQILQNDRSPTLAARR
jgi:hypothetical protein